MVNPLGTNEHEQIPIEPLASKDASSASSTEAASKTQEKKTEGPTPQAVERWSFLSAARNALSSLVNRLLGVASSAPTTSPDTPSVDSTDPTNPTNPTDPVDPAPPTLTFDDYKTQAETAYNTFLTSTDYSAVQAAAVSLQEAVNKMNELAAEDTATEEQKTTAAEWNTKNTNVTQVNAQLAEVSQLLQEIQSLGSSIPSLDAIELVQAAQLNSQEKAAQATEKLEAMETEENPPLGEVPAFVSTLKEQVEAANKNTDKTAQDIIDAYNAGENAYGSVQQAMANNSQANIDAANAQITQAKETIQNALQTYQNSPVLQTALSRVTEAEAALKNIKPAEAPSSGGAASAGSAQHRSFSVGNVRVALLLDDAESESTATVLSGLRKMIELFQSGTTVGGEAQKAETEAEAANDSTTTEEEAQAAVEEALQTMAEAKTREGLINAMGQIASAAMVSAGVPQAAAAPVAKSVKQLYSASSSTSSKRFADGYSAYQSLTDTLSSINDRGRNALDAATQSALSQPVPRRTETRARGSEDLSQRVARSIAEDSKTYGDIYARVGALESLSTVLQNNPNANDAEIKQALMSEVNKPPKFGYPYVQLPSESMQKYLGKLMQEFVDGTKAAAERKMLSFDTRTQFIQQVLVNLGSLYAAYLS